MKIGIPVYNFDPKKGGAERYAFDLSLNLARKGLTPYIFCAKGIEANWVKKVIIKTTPFPRWLRNLSFAISHRRKLRECPVDVMIGFGNTLTADLYQSHGGVHRVWLQRELLSYNKTLERHIKAFILKRSINQRIQEWVSEYPLRKRGFKRIIAISNMVKNHLVEHLKLDEDLIEVVYNGVDTERFKPAPKKGSADGLRILFSAGNFRLKGLGELLVALGELSKTRRDFRLIVMGRGKKGRYKRVAEEIGLKDRVIFLGERLAPETVYREADILCHPTYYDACSLTIMEAMATGLPVITTRWNGAAALVNDGGFVIDEPYDIKGMVSAITELFDHEKRYEMGKKARSWMERYTIQKNADEIERIILKTIL